MLSYMNYLFPYKIFKFNADFKMFKSCNLVYKSLKSNNEIVIFKANKGNSFVVLNKKD